MYSSLRLACKDITSREEKVKIRGQLLTTTSTSLQSTHSRIQNPCMFACVH